MPAPLAPHPDNPNSPQRLSYMDAAKPVEMPDSGGRPTEPHIIQLEAEFDPINGEGCWQFYQYPNFVEFREWDQFKRFVRRSFLKMDPHSFEELLDYVHNFKVINIDTKRGEVYPVIPRPTGYVLQIPNSI